MFQPGDKVIYSKPRKSWAEGGWWDDLPATVERQTSEYRYTIRLDATGKRVNIKGLSMRPAQRT